MRSPHRELRSERFDRWTIGAAGVVALLMLGIALTLQSIVRLNGEVGDLSRAHAVTDAIAELRGALREAEASQRTYLITGDPKYPEQANERFDDAFRRIDELRQLTDRSEPRLEGISNAVLEFSAALRSTAEVRDELGFEAGRLLVVEEQSQALMERIDLQLRDLERDERGRLDRRLQDRTESFRWALFVGFASGLVAIAGMLAFLALLRRHLTEQRRATRVIAERLADARLLSTIVESSRDPIVSKTLDGIIRSWNTAAERLFGYSADHAIGRNILFLIPEDRRDEETRIVEKLRAGERIEQFETVRTKSDGSEIEVSLTVSPLFDERGQVVGASKIVRDITERKRIERALRESEERFRTLADHMSQLAWMADSTGWIFWYNRRWYDYTGTDAEAVRGWGWRSLHHPDHVDRVVERITHSFRTGEVWEDLFPLRGADGEYRWFLSRAVPIRGEEGTIVRWLGTNTDVTAQREAEEALRETDRRRNEFLAMLAHELRNPLAPIRHGLEVISRDRSFDESTVDLMKRQVEQLVRLVDDLLDVSRVMQGKVRLHRGPLIAELLLERCARAIVGTMERRGQTLDVAIEPGRTTLSGDEVRLAQAVGNLLANASKYSDHGGTIRLSGIRRDDHYEIVVSDDGIGIDPPLLPRIFDLFEQSDQTLDRSRGGLGIGLTVVRQSIERHGGTVTAESEGTGRGATFRIRLPLAPASEPVSESQSAASRNDVACPPRRVLIVDDNVGAAWMLSRLIAKIGDHTVETAHDGRTALSILSRFRPDIAFFDIGLPEMDGYDLARAARATEAGRAAVLVALTGYGQDEDRRRALAAGFDLHLIKPASLDRLTALLAALPDPRPSRSPATPD
ncbi:MAG TPA: hypothetical protein DCQ98_20565 [Planctomycetaceae bacterium]|nr:hypothetical protein [Planctomycetaceae bacterium]HRE98983.1 PAS domain S-box protein [Pirellulaceae bacterium]